jgi:hypothetical protein
MQSWLLLGRTANRGAREVALPSPDTTTATKRFKKGEHATTLLWKVLQIAEPTFRRLQGAELLRPCMPVRRMSMAGSRQ